MLCKQMVFAACEIIYLDFTQYEKLGWHPAQIHNDHKVNKHQALKCVAAQFLSRLTNAKLEYKTCLIPKSVLFHPLLSINSQSPSVSSPHPFKILDRVPLHSLGWPGACQITVHSALELTSSCLGLLRVDFLVPMPSSLSVCLPATKAASFQLFSVLCPNYYPSSFVDFLELLNWSLI